MWRSNHLEVAQRVHGALGGLSTDVIHEHFRVDAGAEVASGRRVFAVVICSAAYDPSSGIVNKMMLLLREELFHQEMFANLAE